MAKLILVLIAVVVLTGCSSSVTQSVTSPTTATLNSAPTLPKWQSLTLTDARNGKTFTLAEFKGKTVYVEPMATWCTNCRQQLANVKIARDKLNDDDKYVFVGLSVETELKSQELADYVKSTGYDWHFAVLTPEALTELSNTFGRTIANPPSTPHFVIYPDGRVTALIAGSIESPEEVLKLLSGVNGT